MKPTDLMIQDLVAYNNNGKWVIARVLTITSRDVDKSNEVYIQYGDKRKWVAASELEPIELTPRILQLNGFDHEYSPPVGKFSHELHKYRYQKEFHQFTVWYQCGRFELGDFGSHRIKFVNDLQHMIRFGGLEQLSENFNV